MRSECSEFEHDTPLLFQASAYLFASIRLRKLCPLLAERSEAMVQRKTGGRQNVVLLRTLKRTRLASASTCLILGWRSFYKKKHINFYRTIYRAPGRCVRFCICTASDVHQSKGSPSKKAQNWKFNERQRTEWKECRKDMRRKQWRERKENKEGEKKNGGPRGCPPARCGHKFSKRKKKK